MSEDEIKAVLVRRIEGIKKKDAHSIADLADKDRYTKFDDWPPFERQGLDALNREAEALKVLKEYNYEINGWKIDVVNNVAIASFIINYRGTIRDLNFNIKSRVTAVLTKIHDEWKIIHEHWSRFPQTWQEMPQRPRRRFPFP
ncbi:MAG: nuclear transport factor 2 family protein [Candidatus Bathyarchaeia archaeon]